MKIVEVQIKICSINKALRGLKDEHKRCFARHMENLSLDYSWLLRLFSNFFDDISNTSSLINDLHQIYPLESYSPVTSNLKEYLETSISLLKQDPIDPNKHEFLLENLKYIHNWILTDIPVIENELKEISDSCKKLTRFKINKDLIKQKSQYLYHGVKFQYVQEILERESILGYTTQRHWENGKRYKDDHPEYNNSYWMKGISMSRDFEYSLAWGGVLLIFDKTLIHQKHEIQPYSWNYHMKGNFENKREREDFVILSKKKKSYKNKDNPAWRKEFDEIMAVDLENLKKELSEDEFNGYLLLQKEMKEKAEQVNIKDISEAEGEFDFSKNKALIGIVLREHIPTIYGIDNPTVQFILNHPLFMGILDD